MSREWLSSAEASRRLAVSSATLYAYVSRGLLRSEPGATDTAQQQPEATFARAGVLGNGCL